MDIKSMSQTDLDDLQAELDIRKKELKDQEMRERKEVAKANIEELQESKDVILSLIKHSRTSCSDDNVSNGYGSATYGARCSKCMLIEILNGEHDYDFDVNFDVIFKKIG